MAFNKTTARKAGKKSKRGEAKTTRQARELFMEIMNGEIDHIQTALAQIREKNPEKYLDTMSKLMKYYMPSQVEAGVTDGEKHERIKINLGGQIVEI
jgi:anthranilate phosphoribosyltransferase